ncbi:hypothetical protein ACFU98_11460 [Streptomyces sp. NPDC057575]|uniref:hypothetical protein n=1 Tax=Streptomyces sp. NPDC057575 TaxID=3346170 RepID=UPI0036829793
MLGIEYRVESGEGSIGPDAAAPGVDSRMGIRVGHAEAGEEEQNGLDFTGHGHGRDDRVQVLTSMSVVADGLPHTAVPTARQTGR